MAYHSFLSHLWVSAGRRPIRWLASRARPCHTHCARYVAHIVAHCHTISHSAKVCDRVTHSVVTALDRVDLPSPSVQSVCASGAGVRVSVTELACKELAQSSLLQMCSAANVSALGFTVSACKSQPATSVAKNTRAFGTPCLCDSCDKE